jgi:hypothetical protein
MHVFGVDLIMKIMQILFILNYIFHILISCIENIFDTEKKSEIHSFISSYFLQ